MGQQSQCPMCGAIFMIPVVQAGPAAPGGWPAGYQPPPGYAPPPGYGQPGYGQPAYPQPGYAPPFEVLDVVVISERRRGNSMFAEATVKLKIGSEVVHEVAEGAGPVHALDGAFHKALNPHFPLVRDVRLADYKVRILDPDAATGAKTRVLIEAARGEERWSTIGVSQNIIEASATALADALELPLARLAAAARIPESAVG